MAPAKFWGRGLGLFSPANNPTDLARVLLTATEKPILPSKLALRALEYSTENIIKNMNTY